jgi:hypothetical protein
VAPAQVAHITYRGCFHEIDTEVVRSIVIALSRCPLLEELKLTGFYLWYARNSVILDIVYTQPRSIFAPTGWSIVRALAAMQMRLQVR